LCFFIDAHVVCKKVELQMQEVVCRIAGQSMAVVACQLVFCRTFTRTFFRAFSCCKASTPQRKYTWMELARPKRKQKRKCYNCRHSNISSV
jgi:hypothetical protein